MHYSDNECERVAMDINALQTSINYIIVSDTYFLSDTECFPAMRNLCSTILAEKSRLKSKNTFATNTRLY